VAAAGVGAFLGQFIAVVGWGAGTLKLGMFVGAGTGVALIVAWLFAFVILNKPSATDWTEYQRKVTGFIAEMKKRGMSTNEAFPLTSQLAVGLGFQVPPPQFLGTGARLFTFAAVVFPLYCMAGAVFWWEHPITSIWFMAITSVIPFLLCAIEFHLGRKMQRTEIEKYQLPSWNEYSPPDVSHEN
jgi:hypothetical protein